MEKSWAETLLQTLMCNFNYYTGVEYTAYFFKRNESA